MRAGGGAGGGGARGAVGPRAGARHGRSSSDAVAGRAASAGDDAAAGGVGAGPPPTPRPGRARAAGWPCSPRGLGHSPGRPRPPRPRRPRSGTLRGGRWPRRWLVLPRSSDGRGVGIRLLSRSAAGASVRGGPGGLRRLRRDVAGVGGISRRCVFS